MQRQPFRAWDFCVKNLDVQCELQVGEDVIGHSVSVVMDFDQIVRLSNFPALNFVRRQLTLPWHCMYNIAIGRILTCHPLIHFSTHFFHFYLP